MSLPNAIKGDIVRKVVQNLSDSEPKTTFLGFLLAALVATKVDYGKLLAGDSTQIASAISAVVIAALGYYTNNRKA